ncbi:hypothetical protein [Clostridium sp.]|uniref:hypothetical protein n=1 Tax=Clostridium sp. TaxID=1506 RepID=UPI003464282D
MKKLIRSFFKGVEFFKEDILLLLPFSLGIILTGNEKIIYIWFALIMAKEGYKVFKGKTSLEEMLFTLTLYSYIVAGNYTPMVFTGFLLIYYLYKIFKGHRHVSFSKKEKWIILAVAIYMVFGVLYNKVPLINVLLYLMYNFTFIAMAFIVVKCKPYEHGRTLTKVMNTMVIAQMLHLIIYIPLRMDVIILHRIGDWAIGTLGTSQGPMLFNLFIFSFIRFFVMYKESRSKNLIVWMGLMFIFSLLTVSTALTMLFIGTLILYGIIFSPRRLKVVVLTSVIAFAAIFYIASPSWIRYQVNSTLFDPAFRRDNIKKLAYYEDTFITAPKKYHSFALFGGGIGSYSSRAALTSSGYYASWYNKLNLPIYNGKYMRKYVKPRLYLRYGLSVVDQPTSQYIAIMGELGYIGIFVVLALILTNFVRSDNNKLTILYFSIILIIDNWVEYPKISVLFFVTYYLIESYCLNKESKTKRLD